MANDLRIEYRGSGGCYDCHIINRLFFDLCLGQLGVKFPKEPKYHLLIDKKDGVVKAHSKDQWIDCIGRNLAKDYDYRYVGYNPARE